MNKEDKEAWGLLIAAVVMILVNCGIAIWCYTTGNYAMTAIECLFIGMLTYVCVRLIKYLKG